MLLLEEVGIGSEGWITGIGPKKKSDKSRDNAESECIYIQ